MVPASTVKVQSGLARFGLREEERVDHERRVHHRPRDALLGQAMVVNMSECNGEGAVHGRGAHDDNRTDSSRYLFGRSLTSP